MQIIATKKRAAVVALSLCVLFLAAATTLVNLTNQVTGTLPHGNGGTDVTSPSTSQNVLYSNGSNWVSQRLQCSDISDAGTGCQTGGPILTGGILGGFYGAALATTNILAPWVSGGSTIDQRTSYPIAMAFRHLSVYMTDSVAVNGNLAFQFQGYYTTSATSADVVQGRLMILSAQPSGVYTESPLSPPFFVNKGGQVAIPINGNNITGSHMAGFSWDAYGTTSQPLGWFPANSSVAGSSTRYGSPGYVNGVGNATENIVGVIVPYNSTAQTLCQYYPGSQPSGGSLDTTLDLTHAGSTSATALTISVAAGAINSYTCDTTHTVSISAGDWISWKQVNNSATLSGGQYVVSMELVPTGSATAMIVFNTATQTIASGSAKYFPPFANAAALTTESSARAPMPRAGTMKNLYCLLTTNPGTSNATATVYKNGSPTSLVATLPTTGCTNSVCFDTTHTVSFAAGDTFDIEFNQASGTNPAVSSCSAEFD